MTWLTWRQARTQIAILGAIVATLAVVLALTGFGLFDLYSADKATFIDQLQLDTLRAPVYILGTLSLYAAPPLIGAFLGAPLIARELEAGTHRLVWTQSTTRTRWLATKLGLVALAGLGIAGALSVAVTWWSSPIDTSINAGHGSGQFTLARISPIAFAARDIVPVGYTAFALAVGVTAGLVLRRSVPAIALTLALTAAVQITIPLVVRAHLVTPKTTYITISAANFDGVRGDGPVHADTRSQPQFLRHASLLITSSSPGAWELSNTTVDAQGRTDLTLPGWVLQCAGVGPASTPEPDPVNGVRQASSSEQACFDRLAAQGYRQKVSTLPADRFWPLQIRETGLLLVGALLLTGFCFRRIRRDLV